VSVQDVAAAAAELELAERKLRDAVVAADRAGVPQAVIARAANRARNTIIRWIKDAT
jgi:hypothetical protein